MAQGNGALGNGTLSLETEGAVGRVEWAIVETGSGKELASGVLTVTPEAVEVDEHRTAENVTYYRKRIRLAGPYQFAIDEHPDRRPEDLKGFGMTGIHDEVQTYSWEWFNVTGPTEAVKLQEEGRVAIEVGSSLVGYEVVRTEFLTDVSLRLTRFFGDPTQEPYWRIAIRKGSWVAWPAAG